ncbi:MAG: filamentous hemagglutinin N-terminal domain-containing protein [Desulfohalobiaceae bacterium]|nr:filamentous hemagglutinin N-terminal domain-containing protein [Desulfohalobiaceae bacterium]
METLETYRLKILDTWTVLFDCIPGRRWLPIYLIVVFASVFPVQASVVTDGTMGPAAVLPGPDYRIGQELGTRVGHNLFHSFRRFGLSHRESATFTGPDDIANLISRVTGGEVSAIDGLLRSEVGRADFYFINPAGVVFGENAQVDVPAAFHVSTADELYLEDGAVFSAADPDGSTLSLARPEAFGFLSPQAASIKVNGCTLEFEQGSTVSLSGGNLSISGAREERAGLICEGGDIQLKAIGNTSGEMLIHDYLASEATGTVILDKALITSSGNGGGSVLIQSGKAKMSDSSIDVKNTGTDDAGQGIVLMINGFLELNKDVSISSDSCAKGKAGDILIKAQKMHAGNNVNISSSTNAEGDSGRVVITVAGALDLADSILITTETFGEDEGPEATGIAGTVRIKAANLNIVGEQGLTFITSLSSQSKGDAGTVHITVDGMLEVVNGAVFSSDTFGQGNAGTVVVKAEELKACNTSITSTSYWEDSNPGTIHVFVDDRLSLLEESNIISINWGGGNDPGKVKVEAGELIIVGEGTFRRSVYSNIGTESYWGDAGEVEVTVDGLLEMYDGADISSSSFSEGDAGRVTIHAGHIKMENSVIASETSNGGNAGMVQVSVAGPLELLNQAKVSTNTSQGGKNAGDVIIEAGEIFIDAWNKPGFTGISSSAQKDASGLVGNIDITAESVTISNAGGISIEAFQTLPENVLFDMPESSIRVDTARLFLKNGSSITAESNGNVPAGSVHVLADVLVLQDTSSITTSALVSHGGDITVRGNGHLLLRNSLITTSTQGGRGGDVVLSPGVLVLDTGFVQANTEKGAKGGDIAVDVQALIPEGGQLRIGGIERLVFQPDSGANVIQAAAPEGNPGNIVITAPEVDISKVLAEVGTAFVIPIQLARDPCLAETMQGGSLVLTGRGGIPAQPEDPSAPCFEGGWLDLLFSTKGDEADGENGTEAR